MEGAIIQMISHGFVSGAMFLCIGVLYDRVHSRQIADYGGVVNTMPKFAAFAMLFAMANCGLPGTSGFVGEFMVILATTGSTSGSAWPPPRWSSAPPTRCGCTSACTSARWRTITWRS
jgi:NADH:ubiquinone oxidoreductase subunit 4 (subunit M)